MNAQAHEVATLTRMEPPQLTPLQQIQMEILREPNPELFKARMEIWREFKAMQAESAYVTAYAEFKKNAPAVVKDLHNDQFGSDYASLGNLVNTTNAALGQFGLNARWSVDQTDPSWIKMTCILSHIEGHKESVTIAGPPDTTGKKNDLQMIKSTLTYLEGATFQAITGVVAREYSQDDDANGAGRATATGAAGAPAGTATPVRRGPQPPEGYEPWAEALKVKAEEGKEPLLKAWKESPMEKRTFMANHEGARWATLKRQADKVTAAATATTGTPQK